ncbi:MAG TPA: M23 family metallopeptidase [Candidatus Binatia bacterium]|nr:M23 family metallopeptidase [Candidatus Binatia bacterium]
MAKARKLSAALIALIILPSGAVFAQSINQIVGGEKAQTEKPAAEATPAPPVAPIILPANAVLPPAPFVIKRSANAIAIPVAPATSIGMIKSSEASPVEAAQTGGLTKPGVEVIQPPMQPAVRIAEPLIKPEARYEERPVISSTVKVGSSFGYRVDPFTGRAKFHSGADIKAAWGDPVAASLSGVVKFAGWHSGYGNLMIVDHGGGVTTHYAHLSSFAVAVGTKVGRGTVIGAAGSTGRSTSPHLHYEVRIDDNPVNPLTPLALDASSEFFLLHPTTTPAQPRVLTTTDSAGPSTTMQQKNN